jgi:dTDP-4-amino-4,6-dideoxygalactose transaminase
MSKAIYVTQPFLPPLEEYVEYLKEIWKTKQLTNDGKFLQEFEKKLEEFTGVKHVLCIANGTLALQLAIRALEFKGEVITTPFTFVATSSSLVWEGCKPIYVDIEPDTLNIDPGKIEEKISEKTTAILSVHVYGNPCDIERIQNIANKYNLKVIYDAAHAFGVTYKDKSIFSNGDISIASFHATKVFHTIEGGAVFTNNDNIAREIFKLRNFGYEKGEIVDVGINAKMNDFSAVMGILNLKYFDECLKKRKKIFEHYIQYLEDNTKVRLMDFTEISNYSYFPIIFNSEEIKQKAISKLNEINVYPRDYFNPSLEEIFGNKKIECEVSYDISKRILCLPVYPDFKLDDLEKVISVINSKL